MQFVMYGLQIVCPYVNTWRILEFYESPLLIRIILIGDSGVERAIGCLAIKLVLRSKIEEPK